MDLLEKYSGNSTDGIVFIQQLYFSTAAQILSQRYLMPVWATWQNIGKLIKTSQNSAFCF